MGAESATLAVGRGIFQTFTKILRMLAAGEPRCGEGNNQPQSGAIDPKVGRKSDRSADWGRGLDDCLSHGLE
jgi:hypothetical protein